MATITVYTQTSQVNRSRSEKSLYFKFGGKYYNSGLRCKEAVHCFEYWRCDQYEIWFDEEMKVEMAKQAKNLLMDKAWQENPVNGEFTFVGHRIVINTCPHCGCCK